MQDLITKKLEFNLKDSNQTKSKYWIQHLKNVDFKNINETGMGKLYTKTFN